MASDAEILEGVRSAFEACPRPQHFTDYTHCCECSEHDDVLSSRDLDSLSIEDIGNMGYDPMCFATDAGFLYYLPAMARIALDEQQKSRDWYVPQFLFHLTYGGPDNRRLRACSTEQRRAIYGLLLHLLDTRRMELEQYRAEPDLKLALQLWN